MGSNGFSALCKHCYFSSTGSKPLRRTAHLDGIRGLGAWSVVNYTLSAFEPFVNYGYGLTPEDGHRGAQLMSWGVMAVRMLGYPQFIVAA